ncbi:putative transmembrane protein [Toxoplasma gondii VEG]|uniref:Transmembrane protein n=1 Tax=Toxoplasma gondii (strain ATCC 50861 / VEG) TaxID=432359 RepID=V5BBF3_TOXGV|nr:putative transmembrane protein [Toxoplasma gondii VEG]
MWGNSRIAKSPSIVSRPRQARSDHQKLEVGWCALLCGRGCAFLSMISCLLVLCIAWLNCVPLPLQASAASSPTSPGTAVTPSLTEDYKDMRSDVLATEASISKDESKAKVQLNESRLPPSGTAPTPASFENERRHAGQDGFFQNGAYAPIQENLLVAAYATKETGSAHHGNVSLGTATEQPLSTRVERREKKDGDSFAKVDPTHNDNLFKDSQGDNGNPLIVVDKEFVCKYPQGGCDESPSDYWYMTSGALSACRQVVPLGRYRWLLVLDLGCAKRQLPHLRIPPAAARRSAFKMGDYGHGVKRTEAAQDGPGDRKTKRDDDEEQKHPWLAPQFSLFPETDCNHNGLIDVRCAVDCGWQPRREATHAPDDEGRDSQRADQASADATSTPPRKTLRCLFQYDKDGLWGMRQEHVKSCFVIDGGCKSPFEEHHRIFCTGWRGQGAGFDPRDPPLPLSNESVGLCMEEDCRYCDAFLHPQTGLVTRGCPNASWKEEGGAYGPACYGRIATASPSRDAARQGSGEDRRKPAQAKPATSEFQDVPAQLADVAVVGTKVEKRKATGGSQRPGSVGDSGTDEKLSVTVPQKNREGRSGSGEGGSTEVSTLSAVSDTEAGEKEREEESIGGSDPLQRLRARSLQGVPSLGNAAGSAAEEPTAKAAAATSEGICFSYSDSALPQLSIYSADEDCYGEWSEWSSCLPFHPVLQLNHRQRQRRDDSATESSTGNKSAPSSEMASMQHPHPDAPIDRKEHFPHASQASVGSFSVYPPSVTDDTSVPNFSNFSVSDAPSQMSSPMRRLSSASPSSEPSSFSSAGMVASETRRPENVSSSSLHRHGDPVAMSSLPGVPVPRAVDKWEVPSYVDGSPAASCYKTRIFQVFIQKHGRGRECIEKEGSVHYVGCEESEGCIDALSAAGSQFQSFLNSILHKTETSSANQQTQQGYGGNTSKRKEVSEEDTTEASVASDDAFFAFWQAQEKRGHGNNTSRKDTGEPQGNSHQNGQHTTPPYSSLTDEEEEAGRLFTPGVCPGRWSSWSSCESDCYARRFFTLTSSVVPSQCFRAAAAMELTQCNSNPPLCGRGFFQTGDALSASSSDKETTRKTSQPTADDELETGEAETDGRYGSASHHSEEDRGEKDSAVRWLQVRVRPDGTAEAFDQDGSRAPLLMVSPDYKGRCGIAVGNWSSCDGLCRRFRVLSVRRLQKHERGDEDDACPMQTPLTRERELCEEPTDYSPMSSYLLPHLQTIQRNSSVQSSPSEPRDTSKLRSCVDPLVVVADLNVSVLFNAPSDSASDGLFGNGDASEAASARSAKKPRRTGSLDDAVFHLSLVRTIARFLDLRPSDLIIEQLNPDYEQQFATSVPSSKATHGSAEKHASFSPRSGPQESPESAGWNATKGTVMQAHQKDVHGKQTRGAAGEVIHAPEAGMLTRGLPEDIRGSAEETDRKKLSAAREEPVESSSTRRLNGSENEEVTNSLAYRRQLGDLEQVAESAFQGADGGGEKAEVVRGKEQSLLFRLKILMPAFSQALQAAGLTEKDLKKRNTETALLSGGHDSRLGDTEEAANRKKRRAADIMDDIEAFQGRVFWLPGPQETRVEIVRVIDRTSSSRKGFGDPSLPVGSLNGLLASLGVLGVDGIRPGLDSEEVPQMVPVFYIDALFDPSPLVLYIVIFCMAVGAMLLFMAICACVLDRWRKQRRADHDAHVELSQRHGASQPPNKFDQAPPFARGLPLWPQPSLEGQNTESSTRSFSRADGRYNASEGFVSNPKYSLPSKGGERLQEVTVSGIPDAYLSAGLEPTLMGKPTFQSAEQSGKQSVGKAFVFNVSKGNSSCPRENDSARAPGTIRVQEPMAQSRRSGDTQRTSGNVAGRPSDQNTDQDQQQNTSRISFLKRLRNLGGGSSREGSYHRFAAALQERGQSESQEGANGKSHSPEVKP